MSPFRITVIMLGKHSMCKRIFSLLFIVSFCISGIALAAKPIDLDNIRGKKPGQGKKDTTTITLQANNDSATTKAGIAVAIDELNNDKGVDDPELLVSILTQPQYGSAILQADNSILYTPGDAYVGVDSFEYDVSLVTGESDTAVVTVAVEEATSSTNNTCAYSVGLSWNVSSNNDIAGYYVYQGTRSGEYVEKVYVGEVFSYDYCVSTPGEYYFAASAENIYGMESDLTAEVMALVP